MHVMRLTPIKMDLLILVGGWEGELPTSFIKHCSENPTFDENNGLL